MHEHFADRADLELYDLEPIPLYNQDFEGDKRPPTVKKHAGRYRGGGRARVLRAGIFNHSIPGVLKNAIDWASRPAFASVLAFKPVAIMASSRGPLGGARCLEHMKVALDLCLCRVTLAREGYRHSRPKARSQKAGCVCGRSLLGFRDRRRSTRCSTKSRCSGNKGARASPRKTQLFDAEDAEDFAEDAEALRKRQRSAIQFTMSTGKGSVISTSPREHTRPSTRTR